MQGKIRFFNLLLRLEDNQSNGPSENNFPSRGVRELDKNRRTLVNRAKKDSDPDFDHLFRSYIVIIMKYKQIAN